MYATHRSHRWVSHIQPSSLSVSRVSSTGRPKHKLYLLAWLLLWLLLKRFYYSQKVEPLFISRLPVLVRLIMENYLRFDITLPTLDTRGTFASCPINLSR